MIKFIKRIKASFVYDDVEPFDQDKAAEKGHGFVRNGVEYIHHSRLPSHETAFRRTSRKLKLTLIAVFLVFILGLTLSWHFTLTLIIALLTLIYFLDLLFNLFLVVRSYSKSPEVLVSEDEIKAQAEKNWPTYTIFCPLYKEWEVLPQFVTAMNRMDYPKDKLQVMLLLEEDDTETIRRVEEYNLPSYFETVIVPHSLPKTKPKACNYGLQKATGEFAVIYDAEDVPDPLQIKKAILAFEKAPANTICIQAKLNFYNPHQNILTRLFTAEYSLWFDLVLTGLQSIQAPIPLGGTSNHFRTKDLHEVKGWDAFNVTEDCDLGIRLVKKGYQTAIINSTTLEEANSDLGNWFSQRTRWIKGYLQTYLVHSRSPRAFLKKKRKLHVVTFQLIVGGKIMSLLINPLMWVITLTYFLFRSSFGDFIESFYPAPVLYMAFFSFIFGNFLYLYYYMIGCYKRDHDELVKYTIFVPFYWLAMSFAAWVAVYKLVVAPHYWSKTRHGLHLKNTKATTQATEFIGQSLVDVGLVTKR